MWLTYAFNFLWVAITAVVSIFLVFFVMLKSICDTEYGYNNYQPGETGLGLHCFNLTRIGTRLVSHLVSDVRLQLSI